MPDSKRQCATCQFFQTAQLSGNGWCTHPKRQLASDVKILVREKELACRNSWGDDLWVDSLSHSTTPLSAPEAPQSLVISSKRMDDEVTSVVDKEARSPERTPGNGDDVVAVTAVRDDQSGVRRPSGPHSANDLNGPANADQDERVRQMARGSKDALNAARKRLTQRRAPGRDHGRPDDPATDPQSDQAPSAQGRDQDSLTPASAPPARTDPYAATPPVPKSEVAARRQETASANDSDRFETVPDVNPEVDLPRLRHFLRADPAHEGHGPIGDGTAPLTSYEMVLRRAQEIKAESSEERTKSARPKAKRPALPPAPRPARPAPGPAATPPDPEPAKSAVVWDVQGELLKVAFESARVAITQPTTQKWAPEPADDPAAEDANVAGLSVDSPDDAFVPIDHDPFEDDLYADPSPRYPREPDSPRASWWRSLNFGRKRQAPEQPAYLDANDYQVEAFNDDGYDNDFASGYEDDWEDQPVNVDAPGYVGVDDEYASDEDVAATFEPDPADDPASFPVTTEASWIEDERAFPTAQPATWHEERARLLASRIPLEPLVLPTPMNEPVTAPMEAATAPDALQPPREPGPFFALDEPSGMDAFRSALFGESRDPDPLTYSIESVALSSPRPAAHREFAEPAPVLTRSAPVDAPPFRQHDRAVSERAARSRHVAEAAGFDPDFDIRDAVRDQDDDGERHFAVASNVKKSCATCRSFHPTEDGRRGWCTNDWASTHRQMVNADDLACRSSIGDWWLAVDTSWIPPVDRIQPDTPRTDRLAARTGEQDATESTIGRRVRTRNVV